MAEPTEADRAQAIEALKYTGWKYEDLVPVAQWNVDGVAQALTDQRAKYEAVASELEQHAAAHQARAFDFLARELPAAANTETGTARGQRDAAERIRQVSAS